MSSDKKKRNRVQGGWAAPTNVRSDRNKPKAQVSPAWTGKIVDQPKERKFVYEEPVEELKEKPAEIVITKTGVYDISTEPSGVSRLRYFPQFIEEQEATEIFDHLFHEIPWRQKSDVKDGVSYLQPRLTAWYGDLPYSYSGVTHPATTEWDPILAMLKERLDSVLGLKFNSVLTNLYRDGHEHLPWHSDNELSLGPQPTIVSLSFGETRNFELRKNPPPDQNGDYTHSQHAQIPLPHGSLLVMEGAVQDDWQHRIPREYHDRDARINLTFRVILPE